MELTNEQIVTRILSEHSILKKKIISSNMTVPDYDLGNFLKKYESYPSQYGEKYIFIK